MRKLSVLVFVLSLSCLAHGGLVITVDGVVDPPDTEITLLPGEDANIGIHGDGQTQPGGFNLGVTRGDPGAVDGSGAAALCGVVENLPVPVLPPWMPPDVFDSPVVYWDASVCESLEGLLVDGVAFHCEGAGDVELVLMDDEGQVLDTQIIHQIGELDYGDCPQPYPTLLTDNGARHGIQEGFYLGQSVDGELDGWPSTEADGDDANDANGVDDEDGVSFKPDIVPGYPADIVPGYPADVSVVASANGLLDAWLDFNIDGDWDDAGEQIFTSFPLKAGSNILAFNVPVDANIGWSYARFRFSTVGWLDPNGPADDGEVEDYMVAITECFPFWYSTYSYWLAYGEPLCWCNSDYGGTGDYQCDGDLDGATEGVLTKYRVGQNDLNLVIANWKKKMSDFPNPCADCDHKPEGILTKYRVSANDLNCVIANWKKRDSDLPGDCPRPE